MIFGPFAGIVVDRVNTKTVLIWTNIGRATATASFIFAPNWQVLLGLIAARSAVDSFFTPAKQSAIQALTQKDGRTQVNALSHGINQSSKIAAPALGGGLLIWMDPQMVFLMNVAVSASAALLLTQLSDLPVSDDDGTEEKPGIRKLLMQGVDEVKASRILYAAITMMAAGFFAMFFYDTLIAPLTRDLGYTQTQLGMSLAAVGAGGLLGSAVMSLAPDFKYPFVLIGAGFGISALVISSIGAAEMAGTSISFMVFVAAFSIIGVCTALAMVPFRTVMQTHVSEKAIGKVTALSEASNTAALLTAPFIGAFLASVLSIGAAFVAGGLVMAAVALRAFWLWRES